jgi:hypothetical protein
VILPELPVVLAPVENVSAPDTPPDPDAADLIATAPLDLVVALPELNDTAPPVVPVVKPPVI